jgi:hypothetical protein
LIGGYKRRPSGGVSQTDRPGITERTTQSESLPFLQLCGLGVSSCSASIIVRLDLGVSRQLTVGQLAFWVRADSRLFAEISTHGTLPVAVDQVRVRRRLDGDRNAVEVKLN